MFRTAGVTGNAIINSQGRATILYVQPEMKFRSPPCHFHHEPPLVIVSTYCLNQTSTIHSVDTGLIYKILKLSFSKHYKI